jgi:hypothetical protein
MSPRRVTGKPTAATERAEPSVRKASGDRAVVRAGARIRLSPSRPHAALCPVPRAPFRLPHRLRQASARASVGPAPARDDQQQRRAAARWLLLRLQLRACPPPRKHRSRGCCKTATSSPRRTSCFRRRGSRWRCTRRRPGQRGRQGRDGTALRQKQGPLPAGAEGNPRETASRSPRSLSPRCGRQSGHPSLAQDEVRHSSRELGSLPQCAARASRRRNDRGARFDSGCRVVAGASTNSSQPAPVGGESGRGRGRPVDRPE